MTDCPNLECLHLDHDTYKDSTTELLNSVVDRLDCLFVSIEKISKQIESFSKHIEELKLRRSNFEKFFLKGTSNLGFIASSR